MAANKAESRVMFENIYEKFIRIHPRKPESNWCKWFKVCIDSPNIPRGLAIPLNKSDHYKVTSTDEFSERIFIELTMSLIFDIKGSVIKAGQVKSFLNAQYNQNKTDKKIFVEYIQLVYSMLGHPYMFGDKQHKAYSEWIRDKMDSFALKQPDSTLLKKQNLRKTPKEKTS